MKRNAKSAVGAADAGDGGLTSPGLPQARKYGNYTVLDDWRASLYKQDDDIVVNVDQLQNSITDGDTITVYFGDAPPPYWVVESDTNPPYDAPYPFLFKAGELPDGTYEVYYTVKNPDSIGGQTYKSPKVSVTIVNCPNRQGVIVDHIRLLPVHPNNAKQDGVHVVVCDEGGNGVPNAWVVFSGPPAATIETPVMQTGPDGHADTMVSYSGSGTITVDIWSGCKYQDANPTFGSSGEGYSLGLQAGPDDQTAYANGEQNHQATAVVKYGGVVATDDGEQQLIDFTLPGEKSAVFTNGQKHIQVKSQGGYAEVSFTDGNELGETVELKATFDTAGLAPAPSPLQFTFKSVWKLDLSKEADDSPPDGTTPDKALATVTDLGQPADDGTLVEFQLDTSSSATFADDIPHIQSWGEKLVTVATSGGTAEAWFVDKSSGDTATLTSFLLKHPKVPSIPPSLQFTFASTVTHDYQLQLSTADDNVPADSLSQNEATAKFTDGDNPSQGTIIFTFEGDNSARFVDTGDPYIVQVTDKKIRVNTKSDGTAKADFVDDHSSGEGVTVTASIQDLQDVHPQPPSLDFTFKSVASNRSLFLFPLNNYANADSTQQNKCLALLTENGQGTDGTVVFTLPKGKSASFIDPQDAYTTYVSPTEIKVKTQGGFAAASFADSNGAGETVTLEACALNTKPATQPFVFKAQGSDAEYSIQLHVNTNNQYGDGSGTDSATATVFKKGIQITEPEEKTVVFTLSPLSNSANFANNTDLLGYYLKYLEVKTQNGQAQALVYDSQAETVKLHATLKDGSAAPATPVELKFKPGSYTIGLDSPNNVDKQPAGGPLDKCIAHITWENQDVYDGTDVQFEVNKSATFDTSNVYKVKSPQCIWMQTLSGKASAEFSDSNLAGEEVTITVSLPNFPSAGSQTKNFKFTPAVTQGYKLVFNNVQDGAAGALYPDQYAKGQAVVTYNDKPPSAPVTVKFQAPNDTVYWPDDWATDSGVGTSDNWIEMETDGNGILNVKIGDRSAETVTITASLPDHSEVTPQPQDFKFKSADPYSGDIYLQADDYSYVGLEQTETVPWGEGSWVYTFPHLYEAGKFTIVSLSENEVAFQALGDGRYLTVYTGNLDGVVNSIITEDNSPSKNSTFSINYENERKSISIQWNGNYVFRQNIYGPGSASVLVVKEGSPDSSCYFTTEEVKS